MARRRILSGGVIAGLVIMLGLTLACTRSEPPPTATPRPDESSPTEVAEQSTQASTAESETDATAQPASQAIGAGTAQAVTQPTSQPSSANSAASVAATALAGTAEGGQTEPQEPRYRMFRSVPKDGIPAIFDPKFITADEAASQMNDGDLVIGLSINGEHHAYSVAFLSSREVVNDVVGGVPVAVTW